MFDNFQLSFNNGCQFIFFQLIVAAHICEVYIFFENLDVVTQLKCWPFMVLLGPALQYNYVILNNLNY